MERRPSVRAALCVVTAVGLAVAAGCVRRAGPSAPAELGRAPSESAEPVRIGSLRTSQLGALVTLEGNITQQCPSVGCWFELDDGTGSVLVDLQPSGFRLRHDRVGQRARVSGTLQRAGNQWRLQATHVVFVETGRRERSTANAASGD